MTNTKRISQALEKHKFGYGSRRASQNRSRMLKCDLTPIVSNTNLYQLKQQKKLKNSHFYPSTGFKSLKTIKKTNVLNRKSSSISSRKSKKSRSSLKSKSSHASFRKINKRLQSLNQSIDESLNSRSSSRTYRYNSRKIAVRSSSLSRLKRQSPSRRSTSTNKSNRMKVKRKDSSVMDIIKDINKRYSIKHLPQETQKKLQRVYSIVNPKIKKEEGRRHAAKNKFKCALEKLISSGGNQKYVEIFRLSDVETISCLMQAMSAESRKSLMGKNLKKTMSKENIKSFEKRNGLRGSVVSIKKPFHHNFDRKSSISSCRSESNRIMRKSSVYYSLKRSPFGR
ncbi:unnamed protein product [Moneuplotes crassus]|uniref:Uncharacterized protein n=1 Tax=Euplotes crassus TaxID=5936 RepID=A0AAD1X1T7_EUPCR|nr:unnamed protein product [Moneuplotes crassus]